LFITISFVKLLVRSRIRDILTYSEWWCAYEFRGEA
jgi:hypothetical protein